MFLLLRDGALKHFSMCFFFFKVVLYTRLRTNVIIYSDHEDFYLIPGATLFTARILL